MKLGKLIKLSLIPLRLKKIFKRAYQNWSKKKLWILFDKTIEAKAKLSSSNEGKNILIEGFWDNPNQFLRLNLVLKALSKEKKINFIGLLRNKNDRSKKTLIAMGVKEFIYIEDTQINRNDSNSAKNLLKNIKNHNEIFNLKLPSNLPPHIFYDTVLKDEKNPQPKRSSVTWEKSLSDIVRLQRFYKKVFTKNKIDLIILSHPWKNEFGMAIYQGLHLGIDCFYLNAMYEMMRIRRFRNFEDLKSPAESISYKEFKLLNKFTREKISNAGKCYLELRSQGKNTDINEQKAYSKKQDSKKLLTKNGINQKKKIVTVFCHAWYDFPHAMGMKNFTDFKDWINLTFKLAQKNKSVTWIFKPHPTESWYGGFYLRDLIKKTPDHIHVIDEGNSVEAILDISDIVITVHGTVAVEAGAKGISVISADQSYYQDWPFVETVKNRSAYIKRLETIEKKDLKIDRKNIQSARSFAYLSIAPAEEKINIQRLIADHSEPKYLFGNLINLLNNQSEAINQQIELIHEWIKSDSENFCIYHKINFHSLKKFEKSIEEIRK